MKYKIVYVHYTLDTGVVESPDFYFHEFNLWLYYIFIRLLLLIAYRCVPSIVGNNVGKIGKYVYGTLTYSGITTN